MRSCTKILWILALERDLCLSSDGTFEKQAMGSGSLWVLTRCNSHVLSQHDIWLFLQNMDTNRLCWRGPCWNIQTLIGCKEENGNNKC